MREAVNNFQKNVFILLLYSSAFFGIIVDLAEIESRTPFYAAFDAMILLLGLLSFSNLQRPLSYILFLFIGCIVLNLSYAEINILAALNGVREILTSVFIVIFLNKVFAEGNEDTANEYVEIVRKFAYVFLALQLPAAVYQYLENGGPGDAVGGTYGAFGSGVLTMSVICLVYFLHLSTNNFRNILFLYFALIPLLLNETKISFILIPLMIFLVRFDLQFKKVVIAVGGALIFFLLFNFYYRDQSLEDSNSVSDIFSEDFLTYYLVGDIYTYGDIPRFTKILLSWQLISEQTNTFYFGIEYGLFKGGDTLRDSDFSRTYYWLLTGTRPYLFFILLQGGVMLLSAFLLLIAYVNRFFRRVNKFQIFLLIVFFIILVYNDIFRIQTFLVLYFFLVYYANSSLYSSHLNKVGNDKLVS